MKPQPQDDGSDRRSNVAVYLRIRPPQSEYTFIDEICQNKRTLRVNKDYEVRSFSFNRIFTPAETQLKVFMTSCAPVLKAVLGGFNGCVLAYGQTGSGKTFTVLGEPERKVQGLLQYALAYLLSTQKNLRLQLSAVQIYMDQLYDVLAEGGGAEAVKLTFTNQSGAVLRGLTAVAVESLKEVESAMELVFRNRKTQKTKMNEKSSRSHAVFIVKVLNPEFKDPSVLNIVDLAGSERVKKSQTISHKAMEETISINSSLTCLAKCIGALAKDPPMEPGQVSAPKPGKIRPGKLTASGELGGARERRRGQSPSSEKNIALSSDKNSSGANHVPYRDSKLTMVLQSSISGHSVLGLIIAISPDAPDTEESFSALRFATCALKLEIRAVRSEHSPKPKPEPEDPTSEEKGPDKAHITGHGVDFDTFGATLKNSGERVLSRPSSGSPHPSRGSDSPNRKPNYFTFDDRRQSQDPEPGVRDKPNGSVREAKPGEGDDWRLERGQLLELIDQLRFENSELQFKLSHHMHEPALRQADFPVAAKKIGAFVLGEPPGRNEALIEELFKDTRRKVAALDRERASARAEVGRLQWILNAIPEEARLPVVKRHLAAVKIQVHFRRYRARKPKKPTSHFQKIKIAMGKNFLNQLNRQLGAQVDKLFLLLKAEPKLN